MELESVGGRGTGWLISRCGIKSASDPVDLLSALYAAPRSLSLFIAQRVLATGRSSHLPFSG